MSTALPALFIGSSREGLPVARALQELLHFDMDPTVWSEGVFHPTASVLRKLVEDARRYDLAVFVFGADDRLQVREHDYSAVRDNVIFEYGLFVGTLGLERCFFVAPFDVRDLRLPSDLLGATALPYNSGRTDNNLVAALGPAASQLRRAWEAVRPREMGARHAAAPACEAPQARLSRMLHVWEQEPLRTDRALLRAGVGEPADDDFPRASIRRVFAFLESVSDAVLSGLLPEEEARSALGATVQVFWPHAATLLAFPGDPDDFWNPPPQLATLYQRWTTT